MLMEGREPQQACAAQRKKACSPNHSTFSTKLSVLIARANQIRKEPIKTLAHYMDEEWLQESWKRLRKGASAGINAVNAQEYTVNLNENINHLRQKLQRGNYKAPPVKRVYISKANGKQRPLGVPTIEDKVAQNAVGLILTAIYEQDFLESSYGFRPKRNAHQAVEGVKQAIAQGKVSWILDTDIQVFFDTLDHNWLMKFVSHRIADKQIQRLIRCWLKAGVLEEGKLIRPSSGSPQGGVVSPILANIYLHYVLDIWVDKIVKPRMKGEIHYFRYADDILFCFQLKEDACKFYKVLKKRLGKFGLKLNETKTKLCRFGKYAKVNAEKCHERRACFNFLGFTFYNGVSRNGKYKVGCRTQSMRLSAAMNRVTTWCKETSSGFVASAVFECCVTRPLPLLWCHR
jgi:RNA-directed DNA polymerase